MRLWENKDANLLALIAHEDVWLVRVLPRIQDISIQNLSLVKLVLSDDLVLNAGIGEALCERLHDALLEGVEASLSLLVAELLVEVLHLEGRYKAGLGQLKGAGGLESESILDIGELKILFVLEVAIHSLKVEAVKLSDCECESLGLVELKSTERPRGVDQLRERKVGDVEAGGQPRGELVGFVIEDRTLSQSLQAGDEGHIVEV